jgi:hypothetical protein
LIVPADATILTAHDGLTEGGFFNQALRPVKHAGPRIPARTAEYGSPSGDALKVLASRAPRLPFPRCQPPDPVMPRRQGREPRSRPINPGTRATSPACHHLGW